MPKALLEFKLPEENYEFRAAAAATDAQIAISDALNIIRTRLKHGQNVSNDEEKVLVEIRSVLIEGQQEES